jgi:hypothetical protein
MLSTSTLNTGPRSGTKSSPYASGYAFSQKP